MDAICEEETEELEINAKLNNADDNEPKHMEVSIDGSDIFSYIEAVEVLQKLEQSAIKLSVNAAAIVHLDCSIKEHFTLPIQRNLCRTPLSVLTFLPKSRIVKLKNMFSRFFY